MPRKRKAQAFNPFAPLRPSALAQMAHQDVNAQIMPLIAQINQEASRRSAAGQQSIAGYTSALAEALAPAAGQTQANYATAQNQQRADDEALAAHLAGIGNQTGSELSAKLSQAGLNPANNAAAIGQGSSGTTFATGHSALSRLLQQGAAAQEYSGQLPNIARLGGAQQSRQFGAQIESQRATQAGDIRSRIPGLVANTTNSLRANELQKAIAVQSGLVAQDKLNLDTSYKQARVNQGARSLDLREASQRSTNLFRKAGLDLKGKQYQIAVQREHRLQQGKSGKTGGYTPSQISKYRATAIDTVKDWKHGVPEVTDASGNVKSPAVPPNANPRSAFRYLVNHGIPPSVADWAVGNVYGKWKAPGERQKRGPSGTGPQ